MAKLNRRHYKASDREAINYCILSSECGGSGLFAICWILLNSQVSARIRNRYKLSLLHFEHRLKVNGAQKKIVWNVKLINIIHLYLMLSHLQDQLVKDTRNVDNFFNQEKSPCLSVCHTYIHPFTKYILSICFPYFLYSFVHFLSFIIVLLFPPFPFSFFPFHSFFRSFLHFFIFLFNPSFYLSFLPLYFSYFCLPIFSFLFHSFFFLCFLSFSPSISLFCSSLRVLFFSSERLISFSFSNFPSHFFFFSFLFLFYFLTFLSLF